MEILAQSVKGEFYQMYVITYKFLYHKLTNIANANYSEMQLKTCLSFGHVQWGCDMVVHLFWICMIGC